MKFRARMALLPAPVLLTVTAFRPFPGPQIVNALKHLKTFSVLEKLDVLEEFVPGGRWRLYEILAVVKKVCTDVEGHGVDQALVGIGEGDVLGIEGLRIRVAWIVQIRADGRDGNGRRARSGWALLHNQLWALPVAPEAPE